MSDLFTPDLRKTLLTSFKTSNTNTPSQITVNAYHQSMHFLGESCFNSLNLNQEYFRMDLASANDLTLKMKPETAIKNQLPITSADTEQKDVTSH